MVKVNPVISKEFLDKLYQEREKYKAHMKVFSKPQNESENTGYVFAKEAYCTIDNLITLYVEGFEHETK